MFVALAAAAGAAEEKPFHVKLPFPEGKSYSVNQGNGGKFSHSDAMNRYAWDFDLPEGSTVTAAAAGRVVDVKQDGKCGGPSPDYFASNNYVIIDHGGGHFSKYMHLQHNSAKVKIGQIVRAGQEIALSGSTGFATSAHLHFQVSDYAGNSQSSIFIDYPNRGGLPQEGDTCKSGPVTHEVDTFTEDTPLPKDALAKNGIELTSSLPSHVFQEGHNYQITGKTSCQGSHVECFLMPSASFDSVNEFSGDIKDDGNFTCDVKMKLPADGNAAEKGYRLTMVVVAQDGSYKSHVNVPIYVSTTPPEQTDGAAATGTDPKIAQR
jgi:hypothetical protein